MSDSYNYHSEYFSAGELDRDEDLAAKVSNLINALISEAGVKREDIRTTWLTRGEAALICIVEWWE
jgi:hypothetical protein